MEEKTNYGTSCALILIVLVTTVLMGCGDKDPEKSECLTVDLTADIMPIIEANCAVTQCHSDALTPILVTEQDVINNADRIRAAVVGRSMPPPSQDPLSSEEIEKIKCWADNLD